MRIKIHFTQWQRYVHLAHPSTPHSVYLPHERIHRVMSLTSCCTLVWTHFRSVIWVSTYMYCNLISLLHDVDATLHLLQRLRSEESLAVNKTMQIFSHQVFPLYRCGCYHETLWLSTTLHPRRSRPATLTFWDNCNWQSRAGCCGWGS